MRRLNSIWTFAVFLFLSFAFVSCEDEDSEPIYGAWESVYVDSWEKHNGELVEESSGPVSKPTQVLFVGPEDLVFLFWDYGRGLESDGDLDHGEYVGDEIVFYWKNWVEVTKIQYVDDDKMVLVSHQIEDLKYVQREYYTKVTYHKTHLLDKN